MKKLALIAVVLIAACGGKKKDDKPAEGSSTATASGSAPAGSGSAAQAGSGSAAAAGSGSGSAVAAGSGSDAPNAVENTGSGAGSGSAAPDPVKFDKLPDGWQAGEGKLDTFEAVNESKFPVDNASFVFEYGVEAKDMPTEPKEYAAILEKSGFKAIKTEKTPTGMYFESEDSFRYSVGSGDKRVYCGGSLYKSDDYNKIPAVRDKVIAEAKKLCQTAKL